MARPPIASSKTTTRHVFISRFSLVDRTANKYGKRRQPLITVIVGSKFSGLSSFHHPANQCPCRDANRKRRRNREHEVSLEALSCVIQDFFGSIAALLCDTPYCSDSIPYRIGNCAGCA
jgi:hypothetical protein